MDGILTVDLKSYLREAGDNKAFLFYRDPVEGLGPTSQPARGSQSALVYQGKLPPEAGETMELTFHFDGASHLSDSQSGGVEGSELDRVGYYSLTEDQGCLLDIPRMEWGELIVSVYPLDEGGFAATVGLTKKHLGQVAACRSSR